MITFEQQKGSVLLMSLIVLGILLISSLAFFRSTESTNLIASNISFKKATTAAANIGVSLSLSSLGSINNEEVNIANVYYAVQQPADGNGIPITVNWQNVPVISISNYNIQFVTERLCNGALPISNIETQCYTGKSSVAISNKSGGPVYKKKSNYYRVTVRVVGPKNATSFIQSIVTKK